MTERLYVLSGKCVVAGERKKLFMSWWLFFCSSVTNVIAINLLIKIKIVAKTQRLNDFKSRLLSSANLKIQSDVHRSNVKERIIVGKYNEEKQMRTQKYQQAQRNVHFEF